VGIQTLEGTVAAVLRSEVNDAKVELNGKVDRSPPVHIGGQINLLSAQLLHRRHDEHEGSRSHHRGIRIPGISAGYKIDKGKLSVDVFYKVEQRRSRLSSTFVVDELQLGDRVDSPDACTCR